MRCLTPLIFMAMLAVVCAQTPVTRVAPAGEAPTAATSPSHVLAASEMVAIKVFGEPDLDTTVRIPDDGRITFPLIGEVTLAGKSVQEATKQIRDRLEARFLVNPQVSISVTEPAKRLFTILGQVQHPGTYRFPDRQSLDLLQVIGIAGGYTRLADPGRITVKRKADGKVYKVNGAKLAKDTGAESFVVGAGDLITVGERLF